MSQLLIITKKILTNILAALYKPFGFSCLLSFFALFFYLYAYYPSEAGKGWKAAIHTWFTAFKVSSFFRKLFLLVFVISMILFRTLLNRDLWMNPLSDVMGGWGIWETVNGERQLTTECILENVILMMPFTGMVMWTFDVEKGVVWEKHKAWPDLLREHRDAAVAASTGDIPSVRHRVQHAWRYAWWTVLHSGKESTRKAVKIENNMIYWGKM